LTGTDEHGEKVAQTAAKNGMEPKDFADKNSAAFEAMTENLDISNDDFIRTTQPEHERQVQAFVRRLLDDGTVYLGEFEGWYDEGQEEYYTETKAKEIEYKSPISGRPLVRATEKNYYFRLSAFQSRLEALFAAQPDFVQPDARRNEVLGRLREGLQDVPMSRTNFTWGVPMPNDRAHVIYVWIDALFNYATALGLAEPDGALFAERSKYWPATYHIIGKEILWFHAVIWPSLLMALELPLPKCVYAHSFWISEGKKMSKTLGNFIDLAAIQSYTETYTLDVFRYFLATQGPLGATDSDFSQAQFHDVYETDLVNTVGNSASRVTAMIAKYFDGVVPSEVHGGSRLVIDEVDWPALTSAAMRSARAKMDAFDLAGAIGESLGIIRRVDAFINSTEPFKVAKDESRRAELGAILYQCAEAIRIASLILWPVCPSKMSELWTALGVTIDPSEGDLNALSAWGGLKPGRHVTKVALFPRLELAGA
ncbi:MAG: methionine--tRNA ligase, partial [Phycisphaerales bacterium]|nr:methionine--tRNA ligase [Phycisphaerales bacterium]